MLDYRRVGKYTVRPMDPMGLELRGTKIQPENLWRDEVIREKNVTQMGDMKMTTLTLPETNIV